MAGPCPSSSLQGHLRGSEQPQALLSSTVTPVGQEGLWRGLTGVTCRTIMMPSPPEALACAGLMLKHQQRPAARDKTLAAKRAGSNGKTQWSEAGNSSKVKMQMFLLLPGSARSPLHGNSQKHDGCSALSGLEGTERGCARALGCPELPLPHGGSRGETKRKAGMKTLLSPVFSWLCKHYQCY